MRTWSRTVAAAFVSEVWRELVVDMMGENNSDLIEISVGGVLGGVGDATTTAGGLGGKEALVDLVFLLLLLFLVLVFVTCRPRLRTRPRRTHWHLLWFAQGEFRA